MLTKLTLLAAIIAFVNCTVYWNNGQLKSTTYNEQVCINDVCSQLTLPLTPLQTSGSLKIDGETTQFDIDKNKETEVVAILGDPGYDGTEQKEIGKLLEQEFLTFLITTGDNCYSYGTLSECQSRFFPTFGPVMKKIDSMITFGNHDNVNPGVFDFLFGPTYNVVKFKHLCIVTFDCMKSSTFSTQLNQAKQDFEGCLWKVGVIHYPLYTRTKYDSDNSGTYSNIRTTFAPELEKMGVDIFISGHSHAYERSFQLKGHYDKSYTLTEEMIVGKTSPFEKEKGVIYVVDASTSKVDKIYNGDHPAMQVTYFDFVYSKITVSKDELLFETFNNKKVLKDSFRITTSTADTTACVSAVCSSKDDFNFYTIENNSFKCEFQLNFPLYSPPYFTNENCISKNTTSSNTPTPSVNSCTKKTIGGRCYFDDSRFDCAICNSGCCQCPDGKNNKCVACGQGFLC